MDIRSNRLYVAHSFDRENAHPDSFGVSCGYAVWPPPIEVDNGTMITPPALEVRKNATIKLELLDVNDNHHLHGNGDVHFTMERITFKKVNR